MKGKYITTHMKIMCAKRKTVRKDIYVQLEETLEVRRKIFQQLQEYSKRAMVIDMYIQHNNAA